MSYAPDYNPSADFSEDEANAVAGRSGVRTQPLDDEFAAIAVAINALNDNLKLIQRDDGQFKDFSVGIYALSTQLRAFIATAGSNPRGPWETFTEYAARDVVDNAGVAYICWQAHTSGASFDGANWIDISGDGSAAASAAGAEAAKIAAESARDDAEAAADTAAAAATAAGSSQVAAANSANNAAASASTASTAAGTAGASASAAAASASAADTAKTAAEAAEANVTAAVAGVQGLALSMVPVRQTVLSGPINASGQAAFGGATGSTVVTASGTLIATAAAGFSSTAQHNRVGAITNPSWTGLSTNGTMYLYLDIAADGTCTTGATATAPVYQAGGTYSVANGQWTFNYTEMTGKLGDGTTANAAYRVFVGEVTVAGAVVSAITWYALQGKAITLNNTVTFDASLNFDHNIGVPNPVMSLSLVNNSTELGYSVGDEIPINCNLPIAVGAGHAPWMNKLQAGLWWKPGLGLAHKTTGAATLFTASKWRWNMRVQRGW